MARKTSFICQNCGAVSSRWQGKCEACGDWNSIIEEASGGGIAAAVGGKVARGARFALSGLGWQEPIAPRVATGIA